MITIKKENRTTIQITEDTQDDLVQLKLVPNETYDNIIKRLLTFYNQHQ